MTNETVRLTHTVKGAGCAAKLAPGDLDRALCGLDLPVDPNLLVGLGQADDAGVYRVSDDLALVQTLDFFPPMVDDPFSFGQIAAANALSDIYAMGGVPKTAMNIVAFPAKTMDISIHPGRILTKKNLQAGDRLILTKPLGTGIISTAIKAGLADQPLIDRVTRAMSTLNRDAAETMAAFPVHACTDITGFGFLGHLAEMVVDSGQGVRIKAASVPVYPEALEWAAMGLIPAGAYNNRNFRGAFVDFGANVAQRVQDLLFDPQTSGGLLIAVAAGEADRLVAALKAKGVESAAIVGEVVEEPVDRIVVE